jgi:lipopolysaccharide export system protein LptA
VQLIRSFLILCVLSIAPTIAIGPALHAQEASGGTSIAFGNRKQDTDAPIDVTSATLAIDENANTALFTGDVVVVQDTMTLYAPWVKVFYLEDQSGISHMHAKDGVTLIQGDEAAEGETADYDLVKDVIVMSGDVLVTQKLSAIASDKMTIKLDDGTALMTGRVKSLLRTNSSTKKKDDDG